MADSNTNKIVGDIPSFPNNLFEPLRCKRKCLESFLFRFNPLGVDISNQLHLVWNTLFLVTSEEIFEEHSELLEPLLRLYTFSGIDIRDGILIGNEIHHIIACFLSEVENDRLFILIRRKRS